MFLAARCFGRQGRRHHPSKIVAKKILVAQSRAFNEKKWYAYIHIGNEGNSVITIAMHLQEELSCPGRSCCQFSV
jgi:hypothetical protein